MPRAGSNSLGAGPGPPRLAGNAENPAEESTEEAT
jgi:hypothetical protein